MSAEQKTAGQLYIEKLKKEFADMTANEADLGFGGKFTDFRDPLTQVDMYKKAEVEAVITYKGKTPEEIKAEAEKFHKKTPGKFRKEGKEIPEGYYDDATETELTDTAPTLTSSRPPVTVGAPSTNIEEPETEEPEDEATSIVDNPEPQPNIPVEPEVQEPPVVEDISSNSANTSSDEEPIVEEPVKPKTFNDYTEEELNQLSEEELAALLDLDNNSSENNS